MSKLRKSIFCICLLGLFVALGPTHIVDAAKVGSNKVGKPVTIYNADGQEAAEITVTEVIDPFEDWSDYGEPQQDERYVIATIKIEVTGKRPFEFVVYNFFVLDSFGHLFSLGYVSRSDSSTVEKPDLEDGNLLPGEEVTGAIAFRVPVDAELTQVVYTGYNEVQQLYLLADLTVIKDAEGS